MLARSWRWFWSPSAVYKLGTIFILGGIAGVMFWGAFNTFMEYTNRMEFCIACHEMKATPYEEYLESPHYKNASGVRAICADCHVPKEWAPKLWRKIQASNEIYHWLAGNLDTEEKFAAKREQLAINVWRSMKDSDSRECRNCHSFQAMDFHEQKNASRKAMKKGMKEGKTCIDCHKGIAHELPDDYDEDSEIPAR